MSRSLLTTVLACMLHVFFEPAYLLWDACPHGNTGGLHAQSASNDDRRIRFDRLSVEQGLSQGSISALLQDRQGFLWIGTDDGLNRFDGYQFLVFRPDPSEQQTLVSNVITALAEDPDGRIWIGTGGAGYQSIEPGTQKLHTHPLESSNGVSLAASVITVLRTDKRGRVWIGTEEDGLHMYDPVTDRLQAQALPGAPRAARIMDIAATRSGRLIIAAREAGLFIADPGSGRMQRLELPRNGRGGVSDAAVLRLLVQHDRYLWVSMADGRMLRHDVRTAEWKQYEILDIRPGAYHTIFRGMTLDAEDNLWIGTASMGVILLNVRSGQLRYLRENRFDPDALPGNSIRCVYTDRLGNIWIGTNGSGLALHSPASKDFDLVAHGTRPGGDIPIHSFRSILQDADSVLWLGGYGGFCSIDRRSGGVRIIRGPEDAANPAGSEIVSEAASSREQHTVPVPISTVFALHQDPRRPDRALLVGTEGAGLFSMDKRSERFTKIWPKAGDPVDLESSYIYEIARTRDGVIWIGTGAGLYRWDAKTRSGGVEHVAPKELTARQGGVFAVYEDRNGFLWVGTARGGLVYYDRLNNDVTVFTHEPGEPGSISDNNIKCIYEDRRGLLWIGTAGGLNLMDVKKGRFRRFGTADGLPNNVVYGILEDLSGYLWLSTNRGIARFHPDGGVVAVYDVHDGLQGNEFNTAAFFKSMSGELFFGGVRGVTHFYPERITRNLAVPPIAFTSVRVGNRDVLPTSAGADTVRLDYQAGSITITFAALSYYRPEKNRYRYRIEGLNPEFIDLGHDRLLSFAGLSPGTYLLQVQGSNNDGTWNLAGARLMLVIEPPFWGTWWFRLLVGIFVAALLLYGIRWRISRIRSQERMLTSEVEHRTSELQHANAKLLQEIEERKRAEAEAYRATATKSEFLAHISHEIRTPMNAILGFTELLQDKIHDEHQRDYLSSISVAGKTLMTLINDVLDLSKIEAGRLELVYKPINVRGIVDEIRQLFAYQMQRRKLTFEVRIRADVPPVLYLDETRIRQILLNLVGNAVKFTEQGGISLEISSAPVAGDRCALSISVKDTGIGIAPSHQERVFEPFRQGRGGKNTDYSGTGLGLAITQRLVQMMDGEITFTSRLGSGTTFRVSLPSVLVADAGLPGTAAQQRSDSGFAEAKSIGAKNYEEAAKSGYDAVADVHATAGSAGGKDDASYSTPELLRGLHHDLQQSELHRWERLKRTYIMHEIEAFAIDVRGKAAHAFYPPLLEWSDRLMREVRSFDMDNLPRTLDQFPGILAALEVRGKDTTSPLNTSSHD